MKLLLYRHWKICVLILSVVLGSMFASLTFNNSVKTVSVRRGTIVESVYGIGTIMTYTSYQLRSGVLSTITNIHTQEGDQVKAGDPLLDLDGKIYRAPFPGTITYFPYRSQENISPQVTVLTLIDFRDRYLVVDLEQEAALRVRPGQTAVLSFDSIRKENYQGTVRSVYSQGQNFLARIDVSDLPQFILPGMTADVAISMAIHKNALLVPIVALDGNFVHLKEGFLSRARPLKVNVGISDGEFVEILGSSLKPGDELEVRNKPET